MLQAAADGFYICFHFFLLVLKETSLKESPSFDQ